MRAVAHVGPEAPADVSRADGALARLRADFRRYFKENGTLGLWEKTRVFLQTEALWAIMIYRFGRFLHHEAPSPIRTLLRYPFALTQLTTRLAVGVYIDPAADVGPGLYIGHSGGIWVAPGTRIGRNCNLNHAVTIGVAGRSRRGVPTIGDHVWIGTKATIAGEVTVGSGAVIGANSLVTSNVPENAVVLGVPARVLGISGSAGHL